MRVGARTNIVPVLAVLLASGATACAGTPRGRLRLGYGDDYCTPPGELPRIEASLASLDTIPFDPALRAHYSIRALGVAYGTGALRDLEAMEEGSREEVRLHGDRVMQSLQIAHQQTSALVAELDCEGERADQLREFMQEREGHMVRMLTVASITAGGGFAIALAFLGRYAGGGIAEEVVGITGGVTTAALGGSIFLVHERREFTHTRNLLAEIWRGPTRSALYPPVVWYYLTQRAFSNAGVQSIRENVIARWSRFEHLDREERARRERLMFGRGGMYSVDDLVIRAALLEQTRAAVALLDQEIDRLAREVLLRSDALTASQQ